MPDIGFMQIVGLLVAGATVITAVRVWLKAIRPFFQRMRRLVNEWEAAQEVIAAQLRHNSGGSLVDRVHYTVEQVDDLKQQHAETNRRLGEVEELLKDRDVRFDSIEEKLNRLLVGTDS